LRRRPAIFIHVQEVDATPDSISDTARFNPADVVAIPPFRKMMVLGTPNVPAVLFGVRPVADS